MKGVRSAHFTKFPKDSEAMQTAWCMAVAFATPWLVGAPLVWLAHRGRVLHGTSWLWTPFVGITAVICVLQNLVVFADLPLRRTTPWFWAAIALLWALMLAFPSGRASLRTLPVRVLLLALAVYLAQSTELLRRGVDEYRGNLITDQYNYVVTAQFLTDIPYSTERCELPEQPWLELALGLKTDRLGHAVLHGFLATTANRDCLDLFFPTLFLSAALIVPAMRLLAPHFGLFGRNAEWIAVLTGVMPGVTAIVADCYLSQAFFISILLAFVAALLRAVKHQTMLSAAGIMFAAAFMIYTEFIPLLVGVSGTIAVVACVTGRASWRTSTAILLVPAILAVLLAPGGWHTVMTIVERSRGLGTQIVLPLPAWQILERVWLDVVRVQSPSSKFAAIGVAAFVIACFVLSIWGWIRYARTAWRTGHTLVPFAAAVALMMLPVAVAITAPGAKYAFFKLLMTVSPLLVLGLGLCVRTRPQVDVNVSYRAVRIAVATIAILLAADTISYQSSVRRRDQKEAGARWNDPELKRVLTALRAEPRSDVVIALGEGDVWVQSGAIIYLGRHHQIRIDSPRKLWMEPLELYKGVPIVAENPTRPGTLIVTRPESDWSQRGEVLVRTERYVLLRAGDGARWSSAFRR